MSRTLSRRLGTLLDSHGRPHDYLRISLTEKCNLRCRYCMPIEGVKLTPSDQLLSAQELYRFSSLLVKNAGVQKIRLTGGEPLVRREIQEIISDLNSLRDDGVKQIGITTNGVALSKRKAKRLRDAGLDTANISLDTLEPMKAEFITRRSKDMHYSVMKAIENSIDAGITTKINCVLQRGLNDDEIVDFVKMSKDLPITVRFIEFMPFNGNEWAKGKRFISLREILRVVTSEFGEVEHQRGERSDVAKNYRVPGFAGNFGIIGSMSQPFCSGCNRVRLTADGMIKNCLFSNEKDDLDLRKYLRDSSISDDELLTIVRDHLQHKKASHGGMEFLEKTRGQNRAMTSIGG